MFVPGTTSPNAKLDNAVIVICVTTKHQVNIVIVALTGGTGVVTTMHKQKCIAECVPAASS